MVMPATQTGDVAVFSFSLTQIVPKLGELLNRKLTNWASQQEARGKEVRLYRQYYDGEHPEQMTAEMRAMLRAARPGTAFHDNYIPLIVQAHADRLTVNTIEADNEAASAWSTDVLDNSRFDAIQADVHDAALRDGDTYVMIGWDDDEDLPVFKHELAYDGRSGMCVVYDSADSDEMLAAVKIWHTSARGDSQDMDTRVNFYLPGKIYKWLCTGGGAPVALPDSFGDVAQSDWGGSIDDVFAPLEIPVVHFRNRGRHNYGQCEFRDCIPHQDALNRVYYSMIFNSELNAFRIRVARGFRPQPDLTPGMWITISPEGPLQAGELADVSEMGAGDSAQYLAQADWIIEQMHRITQTPNPEFMGADATASGEALKQREIGLVGKAKRSQIKFGEAWERCMEVARDVADVYGAQYVPPVKRWRTSWQDAELRNDQMLVQNALAVADKIDDRTFLQTVAPVFGWDEAQIDDILEAKQQQAVDRMLAMASTMPSFSNYQSAPPAQLGAGAVDGQDAPPPGSAAASLPDDILATKAALPQ